MKTNHNLLQYLGEEELEKLIWSENLLNTSLHETEYMVDAKFDRDQKRKISEKTETKYAIHSTLITTYGIEDNSYSSDIQAIITADDLFA